MRRVIMFHVFSRHMTEPVHGGEACLNQEFGRLLCWMGPSGRRRNGRRIEARKQQTVITSHSSLTGLAAQSQLTLSHKSEGLTCFTACCTL